MSMYAWPFPSGMESYRLPLQYENGPAYPGGASLGLVADATPTPLTIEIAAIPHTVAALSRVAVPLSLVMGIPLAGVRVMGLGCRSAVATAVALVLGSGCWGTRQTVSSDTSPRPFDARGPRLQRGVCRPLRQCSAAIGSPSGEWFTPETEVGLPENAASPDRTSPMHAQSRQLHRKEVAEQVEGILDAHPLAGVAYVGIAPVPRSSDTSIKAEHPARTGNRQLKRAFFLAAFAALSDAVSRACYDRE